MNTFSSGEQSGKGHFKQKKEGHHVSLHNVMSLGAMQRFTRMKAYGRGGGSGEGSKNVA